jgi:hypothetical protein
MVANWSGGKMGGGQGAQEMQDAHTPDVSTLDGSEHLAGWEVPDDGTLAKPSSGPADRAKVFVGIEGELMRRRNFLAFVGGTAFGWPLAARAQQPKLPEIGYLFGATREAAMRYLPGLRRGLMETGYTEGQNVLIEYRWADLQFDRQHSPMN